MLGTGVLGAVFKFALNRNITNVRQQSALFDRQEFRIKALEAANDECRKEVAQLYREIGGLRALLRKRGISDDRHPPGSGSV